MINYYTYILLLHNNTYYTGITNNIERRIKEHSTGQSKSTKRHLPIEIIYKQQHKTRKEARRLEVIIKNVGAARYLNKLEYGI